VSVICAVGATHALHHMSWLQLCKLMYDVYVAVMCVPSLSCLLFPGGWSSTAGVAGRVGGMQCSAGGTHPPSAAAAPPFTAAGRNRAAAAAVRKGPNSAAAAA
jgi:hypothetical protein